MSGKIQTSTPIVFPKPDSTRKTWVSQDVGQHLFGRNWSKYRDLEKHDWDNIESPEFVDFNNDKSSNVNDSYFDKKKSDCPSPLRKEDMKLPSMAEETMDIAECLKTCSISKIDVNEDDDIADESTILAGDSFFDSTVMENRLSLGPKMIKKNDSKKSERRLSTIPTPFSFESREESKQERREARDAFKVAIHKFSCLPLHSNSPTKIRIILLQAAMEEMNRKAFHAKPAPKTKPRVFMHDKVGLNVKRIESAVSQPAVKTKNGSISSPKKVQKIKIPKCFRNSLTPKNIEPKVIRMKKDPVVNHLKEPTRINHLREQSKINRLKVQPKIIQTKEQAKINHKKEQPKVNQLKEQREKKAVKKEPVKMNQKSESYPITQSKISLKEKPAVVTKADPKIIKSISDVGEVNKNKPFQVNTSKQSSTIAKSPKLATARRAQQRRLFEEKMKERAIQRQERLIQEAAEKEAREKEEYARLRKLTVHKARPVPQFKNPFLLNTKRQSTEPMTPFFLKRRRMK